MITNDELKTTYGNLSINQLEAEALSEKQSMVDGQIQMTLVLRYLKITKRYKENKHYCKSTFKEYLEGRIGIRYGTYLKNERAVVHYTDQARELGIGLVSKVAATCGPAKAPKALREISKIRKQRKVDSLALASEINIIIDSNRSRKKITKKATDYKAMYEREALAMESARAYILELTKENSKLKAQVKKLKAAVQKYKEEANYPMSASC